MPHPMNPFRLPVAALVVVLGAAMPLVLGAAGLRPVLGEKGKLLLEEHFDAATLPAGWNKNTGVIAVRDGALHASEVASDRHVGAFRKPVPLQDAAVQIDFKLDGATVFHLGFDPAPGQLKKKGHLFAVIISPAGWQIAEQPDKADPKSKTIVHAKAATTFARGEWFTLLLEMKGSDVVAHIAGKEPLRASANDFHVKKPGLVFRVGGKAAHAAVIDNVKVWELK